MKNNIVVFAYSLLYQMKKKDMILENTHFILTIGKAEPKNLKMGRSSTIQREMITTGLISFA